MGRRGGNSSDPFSNTGIDRAGYSDGDFGPDDACYVDHIDKKANRRPDKESKYSNEKTVLDKPINASAARAQRTSAHPNGTSWYRGPKEG
jgi:hypothetical protein